MKTWISGRRWISVSLVVLVCLLWKTVVGLSCPKDCSCQWRNGLPTADCSNLNLTSIPSDIPWNVLVLDVSGNRIRAVENATFLKQHLAHLIKLDMSHCELERIDRAAFAGMSNLRELHLDGNNFAELPVEIYGDIPSLRTLSLRFNRLQRIPNSAFEALSQLETLDLSASQISEIAQAAFGGLENLRSLQLNGNQLRRLGVSTLIGLRSLQQLDLHNNPWQCDCRVRDLSQWMRQRRVGSGYRPTCAGPRALQGVAWDAVATERLVCAPEILSLEAFDILPGRNISIECAVFGDPLPTVTWSYQDVPLDFLANASKYEASRQNLTTHFVHILIIRNASTDIDAGNYQCQAANAAGNATGTMPLFRSAGILSPLEIGVLLTALLVSLGLLVGVVLYCRRSRNKPTPFSKLWKKRKIPSLTGSSDDKFRGVTYFRTSDVTLSTPSSTKSDNLLSIKSAATAPEGTEEKTSDPRDHDDRPRDVQSRDDGSRDVSPHCRLSEENELSPPGADRLSKASNHEEDKDSGIQHEEDSSVRNDSSTGNGICTPQDIFTDSDHESTAKLPSRNVTFSPNICAYPTRSSLRRSPAPSHQPLKVNFLNTAYSAYDSYLGTEV